MSTRLCLSRGHRESPHQELPRRESPRRFSIDPAVFPRDKTLIQAIFTAYAHSLNGLDLSYQNFESEWASLPGVYAAPGGTLLLARLQPTIYDHRDILSENLSPSDAADAAGFARSMWQGQPTEGDPFAGVLGCIADRPPKSSPSSSLPHPRHLAARVDHVPIHPASSSSATRVSTSTSLPNLTTPTASLQPPKTTKSECELKRLCVHSFACSLGIGRALVEAAIAFAKGETLQDHSGEGDDDLINESQDVDGDDDVRQTRAVEFEAKAGTTAGDGARTGAGAGTGAISVRRYDRIQHGSIRCQK